MANHTEINNSFSARLLANWSETDIAYDNIDYKPITGQEWIRCTNIPSITINSALGDSVIHYGIYWIQVFTPLNIGTGRAYELADMLTALFANQQFDEIVCYTADVQRTGDEGHEWFQLNVRINYWSHERT